MLHCERRLDCDTNLLFGVARSRRTRSTGGGAIGVAKSVALTNIPELIAASVVVVVFSATS